LILDILKVDEDSLEFLEQKAFELSEELKATWWEKNKDWFLEGVVK